MGVQWFNEPRQHRVLHIPPERERGGCMCILRVLGLGVLGGDWIGALVSHRKTKYVFLTSLVPVGNRIHHQGGSGCRTHKSCLDRF